MPLTGKTAAEPAPCATDQQEVEILTSRWRAQVLENRDSNYLSDAARGEFNGA
jgi:hypothetical protein